MHDGAVLFTRFGVRVEPDADHVHMSFRRRATTTFDCVQPAREWLLSDRRSKFVAVLVFAALFLVAICVTLGASASTSSNTTTTSHPLTNNTTFPTASAAEVSTATTTAVVPGCVQDWVRYEKKCYKVLGEQAFGGAERDCEQVSGTLASIHTLEQNRFLTKHVRTKYGGPDVKFYIGLQRNFTGHFEWFDGSAHDFQAWQPDEPNNPDAEACVEVWTMYGQSTNGRWNDVDCNEERYALCQKDVENV